MMPVKEQSEQVLFKFPASLSLWGSCCTKKSSRSNTPVVVHPFMNSVHSHLYRYKIVCPCSDICKRKREIPWGISRNIHIRSNSYVGIIQIRYKGRSWLLPLSLRIQAPLLIYMVQYMTKVLFCQGVFCVEWILTRLLWTVIFITFTTTDSRIQCRECRCVRLFGAFAFYPPVAQTRFAQTVGLVAEACLHLITPYSWAFPDLFPWSFCLSM